ncbi:hypothetical protein KBZ14_02810 [Synechococcus sp. HJ21-Hayes]|uniref:hypothetical protein n=1 Tax=unclassified Synechococcus TaxID=2626047 RepID=UPI0020CC0A7C|nr:MULTISPECIES: hypothetical protein [unclassified Synechococcus]MCP9830219.1 hypothetical protein [Synechococcus sp. JJ3a-Johnson]MCP9851802.1 hypothetical protein [Synechococcus sp. HJ21-Hayes]
MVRPRWFASQRAQAGSGWRHWDRFVAVWAGVNLVWVAFDLTYLPLRTFWLQRNLTPLPSVPLVIPLTLLPDITPLYDPVKGIEPHRETEAYLASFRRLDQALQAGESVASVAPLRRRQVLLTEQLINENPFLGSGNAGTLEKIKNRLRQRAGLDSAKQSAAVLLGDRWLTSHPWQQERRFWQQQVLPLVATSYWRSIDENGRPSDHFWRFDLALFQSVFALDILLRVLRLRRRFPGLSWRDALLRRWIDLPLLLPVWRWLRLAPVVERLSGAGLINVEPLRAAVSRAVVSLLALELFEVLALQLVDGTQSLLRSPQWPRWIRSLRSHQSVSLNDERELVELLRLWGPMVLGQVAPRLSPELQSVLGHALQQSMRDLPGGAVMPAALSRQLASGVVDSLMELSRSTADRLAQHDSRQVELLQRFGDRFWEELALALERGGTLERSQQLLCTLLQELKLTYLAQVNRAGIDALMDELDDLTSPAPVSAQQER